MSWNGNESKYRHIKRKPCESHQIRSSNLKSFTDVFDDDLQTTTVSEGTTGCEATVKFVSVKTSPGCSIIMWI